MTIAATGQPVSSQPLDLAALPHDGQAAGTVLAIIDYPVGSGASAGQPSKVKRASPRKPRITAGRISSTIAPAAAANIIAAIGFAATIGLPLNRFVTVHWQAGGAANGPQATGRFLKLAGDWLRLRGVPVTYAWVRETGDLKGEHVHIALHVPPALGHAFGHRQRGWVRAAGARCWRGVINTRPIGDSASHAFVGVRYGRYYTEDLAAAVEYLLKGADAATASAHGLQRARDDGGTLAGKRVATSANIGRAARVGICAA
jgi:hypothetical protein